MSLQRLKAELTVSFGARSFYMELKVVYVIANFLRNAQPLRNRYQI